MDEFFQNIVRILSNTLSGVKNVFIYLGLRQKRSCTKLSPRIVKEPRHIDVHVTKSIEVKPECKVTSKELESDTDNLLPRENENNVDPIGDKSVISKVIDEGLENTIDHDKNDLHALDTDVNVEDKPLFDTTEKEDEPIDENFLDTLLEANDDQDKEITEKKKKIIKKSKKRTSDKRINKESNKPKAITKQTSKYKPTLRTPKSTRRSINHNPYQINANNSRMRTLRMHLHIVFGKRKQCHESLLAERVDYLEDNVVIEDFIGNKSTWFASQDEWYSDIELENLGDLLTNGSEWILASDEYQLKWILSGREIYVLAGSSTGTISGYLPVSRLILFEKHLVLCTKNQEELVRRALGDAGCSKLILLDESKGVPEGWVLFYDVKPTIVIPHEESAGILNILRPIDEVEIIFHGGIRLSRSNWLRTHPPKIHIRGAEQKKVDVLIDNNEANRDQYGIYTTDSWNTSGQHTVFCGGVTQNYELVDETSDWEYFNAYSYNLNTSSGGVVEICGPAILLNSKNDFISLVPSNNSCSIGAFPGQITMSSSSEGVQYDELLVVAEFPIVWALPANPLLCDKSYNTIRLIDYERVVKEIDIKNAKEAHIVLLWAQAILNSSRKNLRIEPNTEITVQLWNEYKKIARKYWRQLR